MKTFNLKTSQSAVQNPASRPQGAHGATGGGLAGGACNAVSAPDPEVPAQKVRRKLTAPYKLRILAEADRCENSGDDLGLLAAVEEHLNDFSRFYPNIHVFQLIEIFEDKLSNDAKTVLYRVIQEALNNVAKHSKADEVSIRCRQIKDRISLKVKDNGTGFDIQRVLGSEKFIGGYGFHSMKERVEIVKGDFRVESAPGEGSTITVSLPLVSE
jgi:signal transduction histidine kinase